MRLSTKTRYAARAMLELALNKADGPLQVKRIARRQQISEKYLEQLIVVLKSAGYVKSVRGPKGGYFLAKDPAEIKLSDIFYSFEGPITTSECVQDIDKCSRSCECVMREVWKKVEESVVDVLDSITLKDLADKSRGSGINYQI